MFALECTAYLKTHLVDQCDMIEMFLNVALNRNQTYTSNKPIFISLKVNCCWQKATLPSLRNLYDRHMIWLIDMQYPRQLLCCHCRNHISVLFFTVVTYNWVWRAFCISIWWSMHLPVDQRYSRVFANPVVWFGMNLYTNKSKEI